MVSTQHNLPAQPTPFVGREKESAAIADLLVKAGRRLVTVLGPGGMGKTRLSLAVAARQLATNRFADGIFFVPLAGLEDSKRIGSVIADSMQLKLEQGESQLLSYLRAKHILIVLDNFEHLLDGGDLITRLLEAAPHLQILVTSRERLRLQGEQVFPIQGLKVDDEAATDDARQLFLQAARRIRPDFRLTKDKLHSLNHICRLVEGMPLALELAAAWLDLLTLSDIAAEIERNLEFLETDIRDVPARHRSMRAVFDTSWQNLSPDLQQLMAQVSAFRGGFTREAAVACTGATLRHLATLANKSLLSFDPTINRYHIHELLRQYSAGQPTSTDARDRHSAYYLDLLVQQSEKLTGGEQEEAMAVIEPEMNNIRAALNHTLRRRQVDRFVPILKALSKFHGYQSRQVEGVLLFDHLRTELSTKPEASPRTLFWAIALQVSFMRSIGNAADARELWPGAQSILADLTTREEDCREEMAYALYVQGFDLYADRPSEARRMLQQSHDLSLELGNVWDAAHALNVQARAARNEGDLEAAEAAVDEALGLFQTLGDRRMVNILHLLSGNLAAIVGCFDEAERRLLAGIEAMRLLNRPLPLANSGLGKLQMVYFFSGRFEEAVAPLAEFRELSEEYGSAWGHAQSGLSTCALYLHQGQYREARAEGKKIIELVRERGLNDFFACEALTLLAQVEIALGNFEDAETHLRQCDSLCDVRPVGMPTYVAGNPLYWGILEATKGETVVAQEHLNSELEEAVGRKDRLNQANVLAGFAYMHGIENDAASALEQYVLASQHPFVANSRWFADVVGGRVQATSKALSSADTDTIRQRCADIDLETAVAALMAQVDKPADKTAVAGTTVGQPLLDPLSERELELLHLVADGKSNREIASELFLALGTVKSHLHNIYQKLDVRSRTQAIVRARELDLL